MQTACNSQPLLFQPQMRRQVQAAFDAGRISSNGGLLLLREVSEGMGFFEQIADCFTDHRDARWTEHSVAELVAQRILGIACGYEDLNDHDVLRDDPLLALAVGKRDVFGENRARKRDKGRPLASHSTLNRIELAPAVLDDSRRDLKVVHHPEAIEDLLVDLFLDDHKQPPDELVFDLDATHDPLHGQQEGRFFHGYYDCYCYLPLFIFCGDHLLAAKLRPSNQDDAAGALEEVRRIVAQVRHRWPDVRIILRGDAGFCRQPLMQWCEETAGVDFVFGIPRNQRLEPRIAQEMAAMKAQVEVTGQAARCFKELTYKTRTSWPYPRRVVAKAEHLVGKRNPRFVVTSLPIERMDARALYEDFYCARGDMENRIKEQQMGMFSDRLSAHTMRANQLRLWFSSLAYVLVSALRRIGLAGTEMARAQAWIIRDRLLKVGALVRQSVRRIRVSLSSSFPLQHVWAQAVRQIHAAAPDVF